jgi:hypothetical protein
VTKTTTTTTINQEMGENKVKDKELQINYHSNFKLKEEILCVIIMKVS